MVDVRIVAIGGASASGKSTLVHELVSILEHHGVHAFIFRQDRFFKTSTDIPYDSAVGERNWEVPAALDLEEMLATLLQIRAAADVATLRHLWAERGLHVDGQGVTRAANAKGDANKGDDDSGSDTVNGVPPAIVSALKLARGSAVVLLDGFLLFHDHAWCARAAFDASIFLVASRDTCRTRRAARSGYACADGEFWVDPPGYFDNLVWPAYVTYNARVLTAISSTVMEDGKLIDGSSEELQLQQLPRVLELDLDLAAAAGPVGMSQRVLALDSEHRAQMMPNVRHALEYIFSS